MALKRDYYEGKGYHVDQVELREVMRQELDSGILFNATKLRNSLGTGISERFSTRSYSDIFRMSSSRMEDGLRYCYDKYGIGDTIIITRSNRNAVRYNQYIRREIHFTENELDAGDILMVVRNNYFYTPEGTPSGFIANGDFIEIRKIIGFEEIYGFRFAKLEVCFYGIEEAEPFEAMVILDTLYTDTPSLTQDQNREFYLRVSEDYTDYKSERARREAIRKDQYLNALQIKFAYALTCHKSQGGQWNAVFVDQGFVKEDQKDDDFTRWLYTAVTRATRELFLLNFSPDQFEN
jgi:exodeoxyribonuclease-5